MYLEITCKGTCQGNPGAGAWGAVIVHKNGETVQKKEPLSKGYSSTTNNRMEMRALIGALEHLGHNQYGIINIFTNLELIARESAAKWAETTWPRAGWRSASGKEIENIDLWKRIATLRQGHIISVHFVKEKDGGEGFYMARKLAHDALSNATELDAGYE